MKLVTYLKNGQDQLALYVDGNLYDTDILHPDLPISMAMFLNYWEDVIPLAKAAEQKIKSGMVRTALSVPNLQAELLAPVPHAVSCRIANAFEVDFAVDSTQGAAFYFSNHNSIQGEGGIICMPGHLEKLDFELQAAIVISKPGKNIPAAEADEYIGGLMIMNGIRTRKMQTANNLSNFGNASGKDFATITGPMLVTTDELEEFETECKENHVGKYWNLAMKCLVNGTTVSEGNLQDMRYSFAEIIESCSYGVQLFAGDIICSGPVRNGSFFALNGAAKVNHPLNEEQWLKEGDIVEIEIDRLGKLTNTIVKEENDY